MSKNLPLSTPFNLYKDGPALERSYKDNSLLYVSKQAVDALWRYKKLMKALTPEVALDSMLNVIEKWLKAEASDSLVYFGLEFEGDRPAHAQFSLDKLFRWAKLGAGKQELDVPLDFNEPYFYERLDKMHQALVEAKLVRWDAKLNDSVSAFLLAAGELSDRMKSYEDVPKIWVDGQVRYFAASNGFSSSGDDAIAVILPATLKP